MERHPRLCIRGPNFVKIAISPNQPQIQCSLYKNFNWLYRNQQADSKVHLKIQRPRIVKQRWIYKERKEGTEEGKERTEGKGLGGRRKAGRTGGRDWTKEGCWRTYFLISSSLGGAERHYTMTWSRFQTDSQIERNRSRASSVSNNVLK